jgi:hypothetical protein
MGQGEFSDLLAIPAATLFGGREQKMPLSPQEAATISTGEKMMAESIISSTDVQLMDRYDDSGSFDTAFSHRNGMTPKVAAHIIKQYRAKGWRGSWFKLQENGTLEIHLRVNDDKEAEWDKALSK